MSRIPNCTVYCTWCIHYDYIDDKGLNKYCTKFNVSSREDRDTLCGGLFKERKKEVIHFKPEPPRPQDKQICINDLTIDQLYRLFDCMKNKKRFFVNESSEYDECEDEEI